MVGQGQVERVTGVHPHLAPRQPVAVGPGGDGGTAAQIEPGTGGGEGDLAYGTGAARLLGRRDLLAAGGDVRTGILGTAGGVGAAVAAAVGTGGEGSRTGDGESGAEHGASGGLRGHAEYTSEERLFTSVQGEGRR
ncbi:hypothetical protein SMICM304S_09423 [Streptomyces microflavus]